ncbi:glycosyl hydrolase [Marisediminicola antarctica]
MRIIALRPFAALIAGLLVASAAVGGGTAAASTHLADAASPVSSGAITVERMGGPDRYAVAIAVSRRAFPVRAPIVFVATGANYPDALSAAPAAAKLGGPLLLTHPTALSAAVRDEITRLAPAKIVVAGGPAAVPDAVLASLRTLAPVVVRLGGADRYVVSRAIADYARGTGSPSAYIATGTNFPDALSAGSAAGGAGAPVVLVRGTQPTLDTPTRELLARLGAKAVRLVGGPAVLSPALSESFTRAGFDVTRLSGADRFAASVSVNADAYSRSSTVYLATGHQFPDALAGAVLAAKDRAPLFIIPSTCVPSAVLHQISALGATRVVLLGGPGALSERVFSLTSCGQTVRTPPPTPTPAPAPTPVPVPVPGPTRAPEQLVFPDEQVAPLIAAIPTRSPKSLGPDRLADGVTPPTNRWFSGLVFGASPEPVFPLPLSFALTARGFNFGVPKVSAGADTIFGGHSPQLSVDTGATSAVVSSYDDASITIEQHTADGVLGTVVIAQGSPLVTFTASRAATITLGQPVTPSGPGVWSSTAAGNQFGLVTKGSVTALSVSLTAGQTAVWVAVPRGGNLASLVKYAGGVTGVDVSYSVDEAAATTTLDYLGAGDTLIAAMPHQQSTLGSVTGCGLGSYPSVYGELTLCAGPGISWSAPRLAPAASLGAGSLHANDRATLLEQLARDVAATPPLPGDTYFGGKALYRLANLLSLATELGDDTSAAILGDRLGRALTEWTQPHGCAIRGERCFVYDEKARGIVGLAASFGSEEFNDHHFHYGYFLHAASIAVAHDPSLMPKIAPVINLLAADIASAGSPGYFPERRVFDAYAGHSWASGTSPFADGNNQESSSEAVTAWNGLALWGAATGNKALVQQAEWMLASEADSARAYWTDFDLDAPVYDGFSHTITSLNWGGKRDYATWFSGEPSAKLGILVLPMSPVAGYLAGDAGRIALNLAPATPAGFDVMFGDYLLMYAALGGPAAADDALARARVLPGRRIDDGNSRSYLLAFIMTR